MVQRNSIKPNTPYMYMGKKVQTCGLIGLIGNSWVYIKDYETGEVYPTFVHVCQLTPYQKQKQEEKVNDGTLSETERRTTQTS